MEEKNLNEKESIALISQMIKNSQNNLEGREGIPFLLWGYISVAVTIAVWTACHFTQNGYWNFLWFAIPVIGWPLMMILNKKHRKGIKTYIDNVIGYIWIFIGIACLVVSLLKMFSADIPILFLVLLLLGIGVGITGAVIKFVPITVGGILCILLSILTLYFGYDGQMIVFAATFLVTMVIPGHILNCRGRKSNREKEVCRA